MHTFLPQYLPYVIYHLVSFIFVSRYTHPVPVDKDLTFTLSSVHEKRVFVMHNRHYLGDGLYLWQYRVNKEVEQLTIAIKYQEEHVGESPYALGNVIPERCFCPTRTLDQWLEDNQCKSSYQQIKDDLSVYEDKGIPLNGLYERLLQEFPRSHGVHYSIIGNKVSYVEPTHNPWLSILAGIHACSNRHRKYNPLIYI